MKKPVLALLTAALLVSMAACSSSKSSSSSTNSTQPGTGGNAGTSAASGLKNVGQHTIGIVESNGQSEVETRWTKTATTAIKDIGWSSDVIDGKGNPGVYQSAIESMISNKVSGIILEAIDAAPVATQLQDAKSAGIPVIASPLSTLGTGADLFTARYAPSDTEFGVVLANYLKSNLPAGSQYVVLDITAVSGAHAAVAGAEPALKQAGFKLAGTVDMDPANIVTAAQNGTSNLIQAHPDAKLLFSCCDFTPAITQPVLATAGKTNVIQAARYDNLSSLDLIRKGANLVLAVANADTGILIAVDQIIAHTVNGTPIDPNAANGKFQFKIVDKSNLPPPGQFVFDPTTQINQFLATWKSEYAIG